MTKPLAVASSILVLSACFACTKSRGSPEALASSGGVGATVGDTPRAPIAKTPGHRFTQGPHEAHYAYRSAPPPPLDALPRFVDGSARCYTSYGAGIGVRGVGPGGGGYPSSSHSSSGYGMGQGRLGGSHAAPSAAPPPKASVPSPSRYDSKAKSAAKKPAAESAFAEGAPAPADSARREESQAPKKEAKGDSAERNRSAQSPEPFREQESPQYAKDDRSRPSTIYLSNDDTMSLSSAQRVLWAIDHYQPIPAEHVRPHELLNYFSFHTSPVAPDHDFSVLPSIAESPTEAGVFELALAVQGRELTQSTRRNANLSYVIDRSGSMAAEGRMDYLKQGLLRSLDELREGDIVHITLFDTTACDLAQNFVVGRDSLSQLQAMIRRLEPEGSTNLHDGLIRGYAAADRTYQPDYTNRVLLITDAIANTGVTDETLIALIGKNYDDRRVRLSGIGVGSDFNDSLLDRLTERGKGAYVFLGSSAEVDAVFGSRFVSLIETIANDVHFKLELPPSLSMRTFYGEEASTQKERVQAIHYFAGTSQMFFSDLSANGFPSQDDIKLSIEYQDPESGRARVEEFVWNVGAIQGAAPNLDKARLVSRFSENLLAFANRPLPPQYRSERYGYRDELGATECGRVSAELSSSAAPIRSDREVQRIESLWNTFCGRYPVAVAPVPPQPRPVPPHYSYSRPVEPEQVRHNDFAPPSRWPDATH